MRLWFDDDREWVSWYIEDEEYWDRVEQDFRQTVPGYRPPEQRIDRGVIEIDLDDDWPPNDFD